MTPEAIQKSENIAILIPSLKKGGGEKQACLLARVLSEHYSVTMILSDVSQGFEAENVTLSNLSEQDIVCLSGGVYKQYRQLCEILRQRSITLLFCYLSRADVLGPIAAHAVGVRRCFQGLRNSVLPLWKTVLELIGSRFSTGAIANSYSGAKVFEKKGIRNISVIPNCFYNTREPEHRLGQYIVRVVTVARFVNQKDYPTSIATMAKAMAADSSIRYTIIGHGELEHKVKQLVEDYGIEDRTEILINPRGVLDLISKADIYLSTSLFEGTSNSIMEAMNVSLPVVATNVGDNARLVEDGVTGYILPVGDVKAFSDAIVRLAADPKLRDRMGVEANLRLQREYSYSAFAKRYLNLVREV